MYGPVAESECGECGGAGVGISSNFKYATVHSAGFPSPPTSLYKFPLLFMYKYKYRIQRKLNYCIVCGIVFAIISYCE